MFPTPNIETDILTPTCISCGYEDFPRPTVSREEIIADLHTEARSIANSKRPSLGRA